MVKPDSPNLSPLHPLADAGQRTIAGVLVGSLCLLAASAALGLIVNHFSPRGVPLFPPPQEQAAPPLPAGLRSISPDQAYAAFQSQSSLFLDARSPEEYARGHIPGALNLPTKDFDSRFPALADRIESAKSIIVYCRSVECSDAVEVAEKLRELIPNSIGVFDRGWETWRAAYPSKQGDQP